MRRLIGGGYLAFSVLLSPALSAGERPEDLATKSAQTWLALVDQGKFGDSWDAAAKLFQKAMTREQWQQALQGVRTPLGKLVSRELKTAEYKSTLPGAPDGS